MRGCAVVAVVVSAKSPDRKIYFWRLDQRKKDFLFGEYSQIDSRNYCNYCKIRRGRLI